ncbi:MAG TPA: hypothetical protein VGR26_02805 [Acidimicrobiales bacterium]|nr:hypothetical protein [Acidimicrobiales bacterium]
MGKLRNDRYVPLHPELVELIATWQQTTPSTSPATVGSLPMTPVGSGGTASPAW